MSLFPFALWIDRDKPCNVCLIGLFHLIDNKVIMHDKENSLQLLNQQGQYMYMFCDP